MKTIFEYDEALGELRDANGAIHYIYGLVGFSSADSNTESSDVIELVKRGVSVDGIIRLKDHDLL